MTMERSYGVKPHYLQPLRLLQDGWPKRQNKVCIPFNCSPAGLNYRTETTQVKQVCSIHFYSSYCKNVSVRKRKNNNNKGEGEGRTGNPTIPQKTTTRKHSF